MVLKEQLKHLFHYSSYLIHQELLMFHPLWGSYRIPSDRVREVLGTDVKPLSEESVDELLTEFLKDFKEGSLESKGWPSSMSAYIVSKAAMNAYTRILAKKYPDFRVNSVCPVYVKTDINFGTGVLPVEEGAASVVNLALLPNNGPSGKFFSRSEERNF